MATRYSVRSATIGSTRDARRVLHLSEGSAYNRIETARAARRYPKVLEALERGDLTLTAVRLLARAPQRVIAVASNGVAFAGSWLAVYLLCQLP